MCSKHGIHERETALGDAPSDPSPRRKGEEMQGDIAWMLVATALVLFMTPGLAFFYGGMVRSKNFLGMLMQNFFCIGLMAVLWALIGYTIACGTIGNGGWFGSFDDIGLSNMAPVSADGIVPGTLLFAAFQMTFAIITPALI